MKSIITATILFSLLSCTQKQAPGPKVVEGACARTAVIYVFMDEEGNPVGMVPTPEGCRCSIVVDDKEYVATSPEKDDTKCQKKTPAPVPTPEQGTSL